MTVGIALPVCALVCFGFVTDPRVPAASLSATTIYVEGSQDVLPTQEEFDPHRLRNTLLGAYTQPLAEGNVFAEYPRSLGVITGLGDPTFDESEEIAADSVIAAIKHARQDSPGKRVYVVGYSQGAGGAAKALERLESAGEPTDDLEFVLLANPRRNDGGILARLPEGVYVPLIGVSVGGGTTPENTNAIQITKQYDGVADAPKYLLNFVAGANAVMGLYYLHGDYYQHVDLNDPRNVVTYSQDGYLTDVLVPTPRGQLPITRPLLDAGVPEEFVIALDPFLRALIETGYDRPEAGSHAYPSQPVGFRLVPPPSRWAADARAVAEGAAETGELLAALIAPSQGGGAGTAPESPTLPVGSAAPADDDPPSLDKRDDALVADDSVRPRIEPRTMRSTSRLGPTKFAPSPTRSRTGWKPRELVRSVLDRPGGPAGPARPVDRDEPTAAGDPTTSGPSPESAKQAAA